MRLVGNVDRQRDDNAHADKVLTFAWTIPNTLTTMDIVFCVQAVNAAGVKSTESCSSSRRTAGATLRSATGWMQAPDSTPSSSR